MATNTLEVAHGVSGLSMDINVKKDTNVANPQASKTGVGFTPEQQAEIQKMIAAGIQQGVAQQTSNALKTPLLSVQTTNLTGPAAALSNAVQSLGTNSVVASTNTASTATSTNNVVSVISVDEARTLLSSASLDDLNAAAKKAGEDLSKNYWRPKGADKVFHVDGWFKDSDYSISKMEDKTAIAHATALKSILDERAKAEQDKKDREFVDKAIEVLKNKEEPKQGVPQTMVDAVQGKPAPAAAAPAPDTAPATPAPSPAASAASTLATAAQLQTVEFTSHDQAKAYLIEVLGLDGYRALSNAAGTQKWIPGANYDTAIKNATSYLKDQPEARAALIKNIKNLMPVYFDNAVTTNDPSLLEAAERVQSRVDVSRPLVSNHTIAERIARNVYGDERLYKLAKDVYNHELKDAYRGEQGKFTAAYNSLSPEQKAIVNYLAGVIKTGCVMPEHVDAQHGKHGRQSKTQTVISAPTGTFGETYRRDDVGVITAPPVGAPVAPVATTVAHSHEGGEVAHTHTAQETERVGRRRRWFGAGVEVMGVEVGAGVQRKQ